MDPARPKARESPTFLNILNKKPYCESHRFFDNKNTRTTRARVTCKHMVHPYCYSWPDPCVPVIPAGDQPSGGLAFGAGQGRLDKVWTERGRGWPRIRGRGGPWGVAGPSPQAYGLHKIMSKFMGRSTSPQKTPPRGRRCYVTYGGSEGSS